MVTPVTRQTRNIAKIGSWRCFIFSDFTCLGICNISSGVFSNVLITSAWKIPRDSGQDSVLLKLIMRKAKVLCGKMHITSPVPRVPACCACAGDVQWPPTVPACAEPEVQTMPTLKMEPGQTQLC